ncbi:hypothetical protein PMAYCL1PPCAC_10254, partial [Pristionchus mayeri]
AEIERQEKEIIQLRTELIEHTKEATESSKIEAVLEIDNLKNQLIQSKISALHCAKGTLKFQEREKLAKLYVCIQLEDG